MSAYRRTLLWMGLGLLVGVLLFAFRPSVRALPEYMTRTGESCAACHVNPAGGGPLTARGLLWVEEGKPDRVPALPGEDASSRPVADGADLYGQFGCSGCHGAAGEGASGPALNGAALSAGELSRITREGKDSMPGYPTDVISDADLANLVRYVQAMSRDGASPELDGEFEAMKPVVATCGSGAAEDDRALQACDGN